MTFLKPITNKTIICVHTTQKMALIIIYINVYDKELTKLGPLHDIQK